jgi:DNA-binding NarL/FixJ family response regulator
MQQSEPRALVVEDLPEVRRGLIGMVERAFPRSAIDEAHDLRAARAQLARGAPYRVVLIDLGLPDGSGLALIRELRKLQPDALIVVTTIYDDDEHVFSAIAGGADGYLLKEHTPDVLAQQLQHLARGLPALSPSIARRILGHFREAPGDQVGVEVSQLTARESEVLSWIGRGLSRVEVARLLAISEHTVAKYLKDIYRKLNITSRAEAALEARKRGLV